MPIQQQYKVVVAGLGKRGKHHSAAFTKNPRFKLIGLCDVDKERLETAKKEFNVSNVDTDAKKIVKELKPDIFCFCTLPTLRLDMIRIGVEAGVKLIAYEKPMAMTMNEAIEIMRLLRDAKIKSIVSHQHRYGEHYQKVKEIISSGAIGRVHTVYGKATGWMLHMISHLIDYSRWYNDNADAEWVIAQASGTGKFKDNHPSPDYIAGFIHFTNGVRGIIECGAGAPDVPEVDYWWGKCQIGAQGTQGFAEVLTRGGWRAVTKDKGVISGPGSMNYEHDTPLYVQDIVAWLDDESRMHPCNGEDAYQGFEIMMAFCRSVVERGQIKLPLGPGYNELEALKAVLKNTPIFPTTPETAKQYT